MSNTSKIILISGASSGIGEATARHLAKQGHTVVVGARRVERIEIVAREIMAEGGSALAIRLDVTDRWNFATFAQEAHRQFGRIDVLVNNAGVMPLSAFADLQIDEWNLMIDVNLRGVLNGVAAVLPIMTAQQRGHVVNIGSVAGYNVNPTAGVYCATKFAVRALSEGLRMESKDLRVTLVSPGLTRTELSDAIRSPETRGMLQGLTDSIGIPAGAIAEAIGFAISQPADVDVNELIVRPTVQG
ncbi:SDR family oxidoreductase [Sphingomonas arantia]|uniref:SDR family oxidoreductase n=1 Tax=Sphingomonas arantia TaxID=1460676 RepID=A0ABW4U2W9_9SPHN